MITFAEYQRRKMERRAQKINRKKKRRVSRRLDSDSENEWYQIQEEPIPSTSAVSPSQTLPRIKFKRKSNETSNNKPTIHADKREDKKKMTKPANVLKEALKVLAESACTNSLDKTIIVFYKWSVMLNRKNQLLVMGELSSGITVKSKPVYKRLSTSSVLSISQHTYILRSDIVDDYCELPDYVKEKFQHGFPVDWENVHELWKQFVIGGCKATFIWSNNSADATNNDLGNKTVERDVEDKPDFLHDHPLPDKPDLLSPLPNNPSTTIHRPAQTTANDLSGNQTSNNNNSNNKNSNYTNGPPQEQATEIPENSDICELLRIVGVDDMVDMVDYEQLNESLRNASGRRYPQRFIEQIIKMYKCLTCLISFKHNMESRPPSEPNAEARDLTQSLIQLQNVNGTMNNVGMGETTAESVCALKDTTCGVLDLGNSRNAPISEKQGGEKFKFTNLMTECECEESMDFTQVGKCTCGAKVQNNAAENAAKRESEISVGIQGVSINDNISSRTSTKSRVQTRQEKGRRKEKEKEKEKENEKEKEKESEKEKEKENEKEKEKENEKVEEKRKEKADKKKKEKLPAASMDFTSLNKANRNFLELKEPVRATSASKKSGAKSYRRSDSAVNTVKSRRNTAGTKVCNEKNSMSVEAVLKDMVYKSHPKLPNNSSKPKVISSEKTDVKVKVVPKVASSFLLYDSDTDSDKSDDKPAETAVLSKNAPLSNVDVQDNDGADASNDCEAFNQPDNQSLRANSLIERTEMLNIIDTSTEYVFGSEANPKILASWTPKIIVREEHKIGFGLVYEGNLLNENGEIVQRKFVTSFVLRRVSVKLFETVDAEYYQLIGQLYDPDNVIPRDLLKVCRSGCPTAIDYFCSVWKALELNDIEKLCQLNFYKRTSSVTVPVSSRGRRVLPPLSYWTGERVSLKNGTPTYDPGDTAAASVLSNPKNTGLKSSADGNTEVQHSASFKMVTKPDGSKTANMDALEKQTAPTLETRSGVSARKASINSRKRIAQQLQYDSSEAESDKENKRNKHNKRQRSSSLNKKAEEDSSFVPNNKSRKRQKVEDDESPVLSRSFTSQAPFHGDFTTSTQMNNTGFSCTFIRNISAVEDDDFSDDDQFLTF